MLDEQQRHHMITSFMETNGEETAMALAESLFSVDHATKADLERFATKADLKGVETRLDAKIDQCATKAELGALEARLERSLRGQVWSFLGATTAIVAIATTVILTFG